MCDYELPPITYTAHLFSLLTVCMCVIVCSVVGVDVRIVLVVFLEAFLGRSSFLPPGGSGLASWYVAAVAGRTERHV